MKTIWKYKLKVTNEQVIEVPKDGEILSLKLQNELPVLYILVDDSNELEPRLIEMFGTMNEIKYGTGTLRKYIDSFPNNDIFMFHVFEYTGV